MKCTTSLLAQAKETTVGFKVSKCNCYINYLKKKTELYFVFPFFKVYHIKNLALKPPVMLSCLIIWFKKVAFVLIRTE